MDKIDVFYTDTERISPSMVSHSHLAMQVETNVLIGRMLDNSPLDWLFGNISTNEIDFDKESMD